MNRFLDSVEKILVSIVSIMLMLIVVITLLQVFYRYVMNDALVWSEELTKLVFIWMTYLGSVVALDRTRHMRIDSIVRLLPQRAQLVIDIAMHSIMGIFLVILTQKAIKVVELTASIMTSALRLPRSLLFLPVAIGAGFMLLYCIRIIFQRIATLRSLTKNLQESTG